MMTDMKAARAAALLTLGLFAAAALLPGMATAQPRCVFLECGPADTPNPRPAEPPRIKPAAPASQARVRHPARPASRGERCRKAEGFDYCVSSVLAPQYGNTYGPEHLADADLRTAWVEGRRGHGEGEYIVVALGGAYQVTAIQIMNGYHKNKRLFQANSRVRQARVRFSNGNERTLTLSDAPGIQTVEFPGVEATWLQFEILSVYPGAKYKDTAVTEFRVLTR